ncbi:hypothetical protein GCM10020221_18890 [Streptomyces thioluteus]|uniref:Gamma-glutamyltransferase n=1 Tax=Streptomyces thioluteus TaxID=66431 RepID=A0ABN3WRD2_STRTU
MLPSKPELRGTIGAVASTHWLASSAAMRILANGGNAFDAAVAAGFVLQVVEPHFNGPGGDVSILAHQAGHDDVQEICGQGPMPQAADIKAFERLGLSSIPGSGLLPACVPGAFGGVDAAALRVRDYAPRRCPRTGDRLRVGRLPAAPRNSTGHHHARPAVPGRVVRIRPGLPHQRPGPRGRQPVRNPTLAQTYQRLLKTAESASPDREAQIEAARYAFYQGFVAQEISDFLASGPMLDATGLRNRALLTGEDLARWEPTVQAATSRAYGPHQVFKPGPWSQGPVFLQQIALLEGFDLPAMGQGSADYLHTVVECTKLAMSDREAWYGDPAFSDVPLDTLLGEEYTRQRRALVGDSAVLTLRPGSPDGRTPFIPSLPHAGRH